MTVIMTDVAAILSLRIGAVLREVGIAMVCEVVAQGEVRRESTMGDLMVKSNALVNGR